MELDYPPHLKYFEKGNFILERILKNPKYYLGNQEKEILTDNIESLICFDNEENINIIDLGSSNGIKALPLVKRCLNIYKLVTYIPIDKSVESINHCIKIYK